jgi:hypothetical protein
MPNGVPITSNYEEIILWEEIIEISNDNTITGENLSALKTNIEMRLGSKLLGCQESSECFFYLTEKRQIVYGQVYFTSYI